MNDFKLYERLLTKYREVKYKNYDMIDETTKLNTLLRRLDRESSLAIGEVIYALIYHHERTKNISFNAVSFNGLILPHYGGVQYKITDLPPVLQQMIIILVNELIDGNCPEQAHG